MQKDSIVMWIKGIKTTVIQLMNASKLDIGDSPEAKFLFPFFGFDFGLDLGVSTRLVGYKDKVTNSELWLVMT